MRRALLLNGFMATGKSSVARRVAARAGRACIDLDARIEARTQTTIARIFETQGESAFRRLERAELEGLLAEADDSSAPAPVVALGGGALLSRDLRLTALDRAVVVTLQASPAELVRRGATRGRPLLSGPDPLPRIQELLELRRRAYQEAHARIDTDGLAPEQVAERVLSVWQRNPVAVAADDRSYCVDVAEHGAIDRLAEVIAPAPVVLLVSDSNVYPLHGSRVLEALASTSARVVSTVLDAGEEHKTLAAPARIWNTALEAEADRNAVVVALGGGVVSDIAGFAASGWMRGVRWVGIPTTLLSMVDASVGGKTGVDLQTAKNAVGSFWQPSAVLCDVSLSSTEPARGYRSALSEVVKTALIGDAALFELLETQVSRINQRAPDLVAELVRRSVRVKARVVGLDERESGPRATLNLGHTLGHALEAQGGYTALTHGEAVSLGLVAALRIGEKLGVTPPDLCQRATHLLRAFGLPTDLSTQPLEAAVQIIGQDKKRAGARLKFVVAHAMANVRTLELPIDELRSLALALR